MTVTAYVAHTQAFGDCAACGEPVDGSVYWVGIGPVAMMFVEKLNLPLCGPQCSTDYDRGARSPATKEQKNGGPR